jgi:hypothetical protein
MIEEDEEKVGDNGIDVVRELSEDDEVNQNGEINRNIYINFQLQIF